MRKLDPQENFPSDSSTIAVSGGLVGNPAARDVLVAIRRISRAIDLHSRSLMQKVGLTSPQLMAMTLLREHGDLSIGKIAGLMHLSHATAAGIVSRLESRGLVIRQRSETDRRCRIVSLTEQGKTVLADAPALLQEQLLSGLSQMKQWEQTQMLASLQRLVEMMQAEQIDASPVLENGPIGKDEDPKTSGTETVSGNTTPRQMPTGQGVTV